MGHVEASLSRDAASRLGIEVDTTARAFQNESIHLEVHVAGGGAADCVRGEVWLPVTKVYTPSLGATTATFAEFSEVLWRHGQRVGRLSGVVSVLNGPRVVQLRSGFYTERGIVPLGPIALDGWATDELADAVADAAGPTPRVPTGDAAAAGAAGCAAAASGVARTLSSDWTDVGAYPARAYSGGVGGMANAKAASLPQFEHPPKGLELPKQVDALLSLVQNLHEVILDLHIDQARRDPAKIHPAKISCRSEPARDTDAPAHASGRRPRRSAPHRTRQSRRSYTASRHLYSSRAASASARGSMGASAPASVPLQERRGLASMGCLARVRTACRARTPRPTRAPTVRTPAFERTCASARRREPRRPPRPPPQQGTIATACHATTPTASPSPRPRATWTPSPSARPASRRPAASRAAPARHAFRRIRAERAPTLSRTRRAGCNFSRAG